MTARKFGPFPVTARKFDPFHDDGLILSAARDWCEADGDRPELPHGDPVTIERLDGEPPLFALTWPDGQRFEVTIDFDEDVKCHLVDRVGP